MKILKKITDHLKYCYGFWCGREFGGFSFFSVLTALSIWLILVIVIIIAAKVLAIIAD